MLDIIGHFTLIDIISMEYNDKTYYFGNVYFRDENGSGDLLRVSCKPEEVNFLQQYIGKDVSDIIKVTYNRYKKQLAPYFDFVLK